MTRRSGDLPKERDKYNEHTKFQYQAVLKLQNLTELPDTALTLVCGRVNEEAQQAEEAEEAERAEETEETKEGADNVKTIIELFNEAYIQDPIPNDVLGQLHRGQTRSKQISLAEYQVGDNGHLLYRKRIYVPNYMPLKLLPIRERWQQDTPGNLKPWSC